MTEYGYMRVSTKEQNEHRQLFALKEWGIEQKNIFMDKQSGKNFERAYYQQLASKLQKGDLLVVKSIDRLGRNYLDIVEQWKRITHDIEADIVIIDMPILDTRRSNDLTGLLISDIVLQVLSYVAQNERENIIQRQSEGIAAAHVRGVQFGRPTKPVPENFTPIYWQWKNKEITHFQAEQALGITKVQFYRLTKRVEALESEEQQYLEVQTFN